MAGGRDKTVVRYLRDEVAAHAPGHRARFDAALGRRLSSMEDLDRVAPLPLAGMGNPTGLVPRPPPPGGGSRRKRARRDAAQLATKPVQWMVQAGHPIGATAGDLERLGLLSERWLRRAGLQGDDLVLNVLPAGPHLPYWQVVLGSLYLGVAATHQPVGAIALGGEPRLRPTVLAGRPHDLARLLEADRASRRPALGGVRLVLAVGSPMEDVLRARLGRLVAAGAPVLGAWAPPGVRAMWWECGNGTGLHTWPEAEVLHLVDPLSGAAAPGGADGEVVWTALGWHGTVLVRMATGVVAGVEQAPCPCGTVGPRLLPAATVPSFLDVLDRNAGVAGWQAELRTCDGFEELVVFLVPRAGARLELLLADLDAELSATQYVVLDGAALDRRITSHGDRRVVDLRA